MKRSNVSLRMMLALWTVTIAGAGLPGSRADAAQCGNSAAGFASWLEAFKQEAAAEGISRTALSRGLEGVTYNRRVIQLAPYSEVLQAQF